MKGLWIYRLDSKPKRLNNYNNYFTRYLETKDEKYFLEFLHFYEPKLNRIAKNFIAKYGLDRERLDDLKQIFSSLLWERLQNYDSELPLLQLIKYDCEREWHNYVRQNCGNISPDNANHYSNMRKVMYLFNRKTGKDYGDIISEIALELKITERTVINCLNASAEFSSVNNLDIHNQANENLIHISGDTLYRTPEQAYFIKERNQKLLTALASLKPSDRKLIEYTLGICTDCLGNKPKKTIREASLLLNLTEDSAQKKLRKILNNLNHNLNCQEEIA